MANNTAYRKIPANTFNEIQKDAGISVKEFDPETFKCGEPDFATSGGFNFTDTPEYTDFGEDIDNCPKMTKQLAELSTREIKISFTAVTLTAATAKEYIGAADVDTADENHVVPRDYIQDSDFVERWFLFPYGDGGLVALHIYDMLSTGGFSFQSTEKEKGTFDVEATCFYDLTNPDVVPYEIYVFDDATATE